jgi:antitoxin component of MazEF toxin-antitoxin module
MKLEIKKIGTSTGLILPEDLLARLRLEQGDRVLVSGRPDRSITITPCNDDDEETLRIARDVMKEYASTFRALAK